WAGGLVGRWEKRFRVDAIAPFDAAVDEPCRATDIGQSTEPLRAYVRPGFFAESQRFAGEHDHRNLLMERAAQRHGRMQRADSRVNHDCGKLSCGLGISAGHADSDLLMARADVQRNSLALRLRFSESFPNRRPLRSRRSENSTHSHM